MILHICPSDILSDPSDINVFLCSQFLCSQVAVSRPSPIVCQRYIGPIASRQGPVVLWFFPRVTEPVERTLRGGFQRTQIVLDHHPYATRVDSVVFVS